ncbi:MAG: zinc ABC transporter substrate-binding protein [Tabrizicola sp.]|uniref:zinc ABC transporter substrate-binding protein n=1 Tax=Tabrizicola sp. TaxID=2005166 RepID=UPI002736F8D5|nr:zinc ABC transporter substrate-binding protein [Tabrizicola sp.]MDP3262602.1 zinc ABC transporter substrate-binding protein [Tabrizicola sp.]MDP3647762.1 zinc ABC transporter substrate-binding protein [Paracoccaceae bacterium]MDZ4068057.1 zinc ABC transporter substrate-binding protein [Tabrizicola sp.]
MRYIITALMASTALPALAEVPGVVTDIPPVHALVSQVMGDLGSPVLLLAKGADEHDFQLRPSQAGEVADAALVVWIGPELTPWLETALKNRPEGAAALALLDAEGTEKIGYGKAEGDDHAGETAEDHAGHADEHDHGAYDPHAWLDPDNAKVWLGLIAAELARIDPDNAAIYAANAATATAGIKALDADLSARLAPMKDRAFVTFHDAYGYFTAHYGLASAGSIALGDAADPGAARLSEIRATLEAGSVACIFPEVQHDPALVVQVADGTGAVIGGALDPVGSSLEPGAGAYAALLTGIAETLVACTAP